MVVAAAVHPVRLSKIVRCVLWVSARCHEYVCAWRLSQCCCSYKYMCNPFIAYRFGRPGVTPRRRPCAAAPTNSPLTPSPPAVGDVGSHCACHVSSAHTTRHRGHSPRLSRSRFPLAPLVSMLVSAPHIPSPAYRTPSLPRRSPRVSHSLRSALAPYGAALVLVHERVGLRADREGAGRGRALPRDGRAHAAGRDEAVRRWRREARLGGRREVRAAARAELLRVAAWWCGSA